MFDVGWSEFMLVVILAIIMMGPKDIPEIVYNFGRIIRRLQYLKFALTRQFDGFMEQMDLHELKKGGLGDLAAHNQRFNLMTPMPNMAKHDDHDHQAHTEPGHEADDDEAFHAEQGVPSDTASPVTEGRNHDNTTPIPTNRESDPIAR